jgi:hypothetical protein
VTPAELSRFKELELKKTLVKQKVLESSPVPPFFFSDESESFKKVNVKTNNSKPLVDKDQDFFQFDSPLDPDASARFKYHIQPDGTPGRKVALIFVMHWNGRLNPYNGIISFIRTTALPISTFIHIPAGRCLNPGEDGGADYDAVGPNINKVVFTAQREVDNLQVFARYLKEHLGFDEVGLFSYSLGSLYATLASVTAPNLFDFGIFHMVADDFTDAIMGGLATQKVAKEIEGKISREDLKKYWSVISPRFYADRFHFLPKHLRVIQCKYDFIFGRENVQRITEKIMEKRPDTEMVKMPGTHTGLSEFPLGLQIMWNNVRFIYKHTKMREYKRSVLFDKIDSGH